MPGSGLMDKPTASSGTYMVDDGKTIRLVGSGFDFSFKSENGKITPSVPNLPKGVQFDPSTNTFSFLTTGVHLEVKNFPFPISMDGTALTAASSEGYDGTVKVVYGGHRLGYGRNLLAFSVDSTGAISAENPGLGVTASGLTLSIEGMPYQVVTEDKSWKISSWLSANSSGNATVYLLPGGYAFQSKGTNVSFFINDQGWLALKQEGPYAEFIALTNAQGAPVGKIMIPDGETKYAARVRQEKADQALHDKVLATSAAVKEKQDFTLVEKMKVYDFPEDQLRYPVELPAEVKPEALKLLAFTDATVRVIPFQLSQDGKTIFFRSDLPQGATRLFRLVTGFDTTGIPPFASQPVALQTTTNPQESVLGNNLLLVKVPAGHQDFPGGKPLAQVPAPILGLARVARPQPWMVTGSFSAPDTLLVKSIDAKLAESGPVFATYQVTYTFQNDKSYIVTLELRANESHVRIGESVNGFTPEDAAFLRLDYGKGQLDPDRRLVATCGGYDPVGGYPSHTGPYDMKVGIDGKIDYCLGIFTPNALTVMQATTFYQDQGTDALLLSVDRLRDWKTFKRAVWSSGRAAENIRFYSKDGQKYLMTGLAGPQRFWAVGLVPRSEMVLQARPGLKHSPIGPELRLYGQLSTWNLNDYKDRAVDWPEKLGAAPFNTPDFKEFQADRDFKALTFEEYQKKYQDFGCWHMLGSMTSFGVTVGRGESALYGDYAMSRASWTPEQREQVRQCLVFLADYMEGDDNQPHHSMLSGHPNFAMDGIHTLAVAAATFPNSPRAKVWRDSFLDFFNEWIDTYMHKDVPELNTRGGRWTEDIACYTGQSLLGTLTAQKGLEAYDGTSLGKNPDTLKLILWMRDSLMSPHDGVRMVPPEGAHARAMEPGGTFWKDFYQFCAEIAPDDPLLAGEMRWMETNGKEGTKPDVRSGLFTDYGAVLHYDFGGKHESYAHMQNIFGNGENQRRYGTGLNYRWTGAGQVYYGARGKVWSYNDMESNGDRFDSSKISAFTIGDKIMTACETDQPLYDFDFAQFYRQPGKIGDEDYARGVMLVRDDYLVLSDEVSTPQTAGTFHWTNLLYNRPEIYQLKPGAPLVETESTDHPSTNWPGPVDKFRSYSGTGDFLTVVAPAAVTATATPFGATVNGEYVFASQQPEEIKQGTAVFSGNYGYARPNQLALFQGAKIGLDGFELRRDGGDFGVSAAADQNRITGQVVGRSGGRIFITPPTGLNPASASVTLDGQAVPHTLEQGAIVFTVDIAQKDGRKNYEIRFGS